MIATSIARKRNSQWAFTRHYK